MKILKKDADNNSSSSSSAANAAVATTTPFHQHHHHHDNDVIMNGYHGNANMTRQLSTSSTTSSMKSHHHHHHGGRSSSESTMILGGGSGSAGGEIRMMTSSNSNFIASHPRNRSNADMVHASYARLLEKVQRVEEENCNLLKIAETHKLEYNKVAAHVVEAEMEQSRLEHECVSLRKKVDELTEENEQLNTKHRSMSESSSPDIMTSSTTPPQGGANHLKHLAQQTGLSEHLINQLFTRLAPFLSVLLTSQDFDSYKDTTTAMMATSLQPCRHQSSEEDSAIDDTNDETPSGQLHLLRHQQPQQQVDNSGYYHLTQHQQFDIIPTATLTSSTSNSSHVTSSSGSQQQPMPCQPTMGIQAKHRAAKVAPPGDQSSWSSSSQQSCFPDSSLHNPPPVATLSPGNSTMTSWGSVANQQPQTACVKGYHGNDEEEWVDTDEAEVGRRVENSLYECLEECRKEEQHNMEDVISMCRDDSFSSQPSQDVAPVTTEHWNNFDDFERKFYNSPCDGPVTFHQHRDPYVTPNDDYVTVDHHRPQEEMGNFPGPIVDNNCIGGDVTTTSNSSSSSNKIIKRNSYEEACGKLDDFIVATTSSPTTYHHGNNNNLQAAGDDDYKTDDESDDVTFPCQQYQQQQQASYQQHQHQQQHVVDGTMAECREPETGILGSCAQLRAEAAPQPLPEVELPVAIPTPSSMTTNNYNKKKSPEKGLFKQKSLQQQQQRNRIEQLSVASQRPIYNNGGDHQRSGSCDFTLLPTRPLLHSSFSAESDLQSHQKIISSSTSSEVVGKKSDHSGRSLVGMMKSKFAKSSGKLSSQKSPRHKDASNEFTAHPGLRPPSGLNSNNNKKTAPSGGQKKKIGTDPRIRRSATEAIIGHKLSGQRCGGEPHLVARLAFPKVDAETFSDEGFAESSTIERMESRDPEPDITHADEGKNDDVVVGVTSQSSNQQMMMRRNCKPSSSSSSSFPSTSSSSTSSSASSSGARKNGYKLQPLISNQDEKPVRCAPQSTKNKSPPQQQQQQQIKPQQQRKNLPAPKIKARGKPSEQVKERSCAASSGAGCENQTSASGQQIADEEGRKNGQCYYGRPLLPSYQEARIKQRMTRTLSNPAATAPVDHQSNTRQPQPASAGQRRPDPPTSSHMTSLPITATPSRSIGYISAPSTVGGKETPVVAGKSKLRSLYASPPSTTEPKNSTSDPAAKPRMKRMTPPSTTKTNNNNNNNSPSRLSRLIRPTR